MLGEMQRAYTGGTPLNVTLRSRRETFDFASRSHWIGRCARSSARFDELNCHRRHLGDVHTS